jgi:putative membrane protein
MAALILSHLRMLPSPTVSAPARQAPARGHWFPKLLLAAYVLLFAGCAIHPAERGTWVAENLPIVAIAATLTVLYVRGVRFSNLAYALMSVLLFMHTIGGYYTFEKVPFDWFNALFGFERNMYDRVAHFSVGFYAYPIIELTDQRGIIRNRVVSYLFPLFAIATVAMAYEIIEWIYAVQAGGSAGAAFLGSQGDIWDAQKDMLADTSGAVVALLLYALVGHGPAGSASPNNRS